MLKSVCFYLHTLTSSVGAAHFMWFHFKHNQPWNESARSSLAHSAHFYLSASIDLSVALFSSFSSQDLFFIRALFSRMLRTEVRAVSVISV